MKRRNFITLLGRCGGCLGMCSKTAYKHYTCDPVESDCRD
jgi:hypothetical protein